jgi:hypothetical protein
MLTLLERAVLDMMLDIPGEKFEILREQLANAQVSSRTMSDAGFFTDFVVPASATVRRDLPDMEISGVGAEFPDLKNGAGFVLFIRDGAIKTLEAFTYDEPWPAKVDGFRLFKAI